MYFFFTLRQNQWYLICGLKMTQTMIMVWDNNKQVWFIVLED